ncbi:hypothetical protein FA048_11105 [Pedobacter polaris]|uniref:Uncharacterized protein n=1 Tax=Pedobacter polaris TaxID=2571273 RepID=A0A4U1CRL2_9SPHI|nr:hypothetical protein [Pedobacter polaris]TKC10711.1 hypothetical protein FA048_11105 [Pedobacter polaris]
MQICWDLKKQTTYLKTFKKAASLLMMSVFLFVSVFQVFHHHDDVQQHTSELSIQKFVKSCDVCHFLAHQNAVPILFSNHFELAKPITAAEVFGGLYDIGFYKFTLQGFTNKGPPALNS